MAEYTLRIRRFDPQSGVAAHWEDHNVDLRPTNSVLDAVLKVKGEHDGSIGIRCSCQQGICGSCGVRINGRPGLACNTHLVEAAARGKGASTSADPDNTVIEIEPLGNMPVIRDLIVDMESVHWKKVRRVTPWLINKLPVPEREYITPHENMLDVTQPMACIQCGACVSDCLSMEVDPLFIGPAALAKAYRFVGDPRDAERHDRLKDLSEDEHGIYDCTHCFNCIDACPKGVAPMSQIMRLRRVAGSDERIVDRNNGHRHEDAFATLIRDYGLLHEAELLPRSYGGNSWLGKFHPDAGKELASSLPVIVKAVLRGKVNIKKAMFGHKIPKPDLSAIKRLYKQIEGRDRRVEFNIYASGREDDLLDEPVKLPFSVTNPQARSPIPPRHDAPLDESTGKPAIAPASEKEIRAATAAAEQEEAAAEQEAAAPQDKSPSYGEDAPKDKSPSFGEDAPKDKSPTFSEEPEEPGDSGSGGATTESES